MYMELVKCLSTGHLLGSRRTEAVVSRCHSLPPAATTVQDSRLVAQTPFVAAAVSPPPEPGASPRQPPCRVLSPALRLNCQCSCRLECQALALPPCWTRPDSALRNPPVTLSFVTVFTTSLFVRSLLPNYVRYLHHMCSRHRAAPVRAWWLLGPTETAAPSHPVPHPPVIFDLLKPPLGPSHVGCKPFLTCSLVDLVQDAGPAFDILLARLSLRSLLPRESPLSPLLLTFLSTPRVDPVFLL